MQSNLWIEDDCAPDAERLDDAYHRIFGVPFEYDKAVKIEDHCDHFHYHMADGAVVSIACYGKQIAYPGIEYRLGDATRPETSGPKIIAHICNNIGAWGAGFVLAVSKCWPEPKAEYKRWCETNDWESQPFLLGETQFVSVEPDVWVANMIAQDNQRSALWPPVKLGVLDDCLGCVMLKAKELGASVHMPRIGCGIGGGDWKAVAPIITRQLCNQGVRVTVYDLPRGLK